MRSSDWSSDVCSSDLITAEAPLQLVLERIARFTERTMPGALCAIHLLSADGKHLQHGAAPSLPKFYWQALDGAEIGDDIGSCGAAASTGKTVDRKSTRMNSSH